MKKKLIFILVAIALITLPLSTSCNGTEPTTSPAATSTPTATASPTGGDANWWDEFGEPQYGGTINIRANDIDAIAFDCLASPMGLYHAYWAEGLFKTDWTVDRDTWSFQRDFAPEEYYTGLLAESWEQTDPQTIVVHLREGVHWQDIEPVSGREFTADDVVYNYDRILGTGNGYTEPLPFFSSEVDMIDKVTATDTYTVEVKFKHDTAVGVYQLFSGNVNLGAPECIEQFGDDPSNIANAVGTGPWIISEIERGTSLTFTKNANYYGEDERHPGNQVPYLDTLKVLVIADMSTAIAAMRTGKLDLIYETGSGLAIQDSEVLAQTNPEIPQEVIEGSYSCLCFNVQNAPFNDVNVRKALQMSVNRTAIAESYYGGAIEGKPSGIVNPAFTGWTVPYDEWSAELQAEYSYDPETAKELLAAAGYPDGFDTSCVLSTSHDADLVQIVQSNLAEIGVNMELETMDRASFYSYIEAKKHQGMCIATQLGSPDKPFNAVKLRTTDYRVNFANVSDPTYDALVETVTAATTLEEVKAGCIEADMYAIEQHWSLCLFPSVTPVAWQPYLKGYSGELLMAAAQFASNSARWWINADEKEALTQ